MSQIIASTYEIIKEIGAGGGGVVYLGKHLRLGKAVTLKADKRSLETKPEALRKEVDALKNLSHSYIPQVYDFVVENGVVYTVIDYIEGESLDKPLKRGEQFSQADVIKWGCQLLEALCYLHSRPPYGILHSDIKPANIMLTPEGDIRLIDFNIALALGEEGAVRVGYSLGYASPEHYGLDYSSGTHMAPEQKAARKIKRTTTYVPEDNVTRTESGQSGSQGSGKKKEILLDVRSDVYSAGATLYHLLTGHRPNSDAKKVVPLQEGQGISAAVAAIINKAMQPNPDERYQTAQEMLDALQSLWRKDPRVVRHRKRCKITAVVLIALFLLGGICTFTGLKQIEKRQALEAEAARQAELAAQQAKSALSSVRASESAYQEGNLPQAVQSALDALSLDTIYNSEAQYALTNALGVYDLSGGFKPYRTIALPSTPLKMSLSPGGTRLAVLTSGEVHIYDTGSGTELAVLPTDPSAFSDVVFRDENTLYYAGADALSCYDLESQQTLWSGQPATGIALSADGSAVAGVYKDAEEAILYNAATGEVRAELSFEGKKQAIIPNDSGLDPGGRLFALDASGQWLAVSFDDGALYVLNTADSENNVILYMESDFNCFEGGFNGDYLAFAASTDGKNGTVAVVDMANLVQTGGFSGDEFLFRVQVDESGFYVSERETLVRMDPLTGEQWEFAYLTTLIEDFVTDGQYVLLSLDDDTFAFYDTNTNPLGTYEGESDFIQLSGECAAVANRREFSVRLFRLELHESSKLCTYDSDFTHTEARISADGSTVMLFGINGFRIYDMSGNLLAEDSIPNKSQIFDQQYRRIDGESYLENIYNDGTIISYSALDGHLISEEQGDPPDITLDETFYTDQYRIERPLHGTPVVYDLETGELIQELDAENSLIYVDQVDDFLILHYTTSGNDLDRTRYGLLVNADSLETLAKLPNLCDVLEDGTLVFDDYSGNLRQCRIYSLQELLSLGEIYGSAD